MRCNVRIGLRDDGQLKCELSSGAVVRTESRQEGEVYTAMGQWPSIMFND